MLGCLPEIVICVVGFIVFKAVFAALGSFFGVTHWLVEVGLFIGAIYVVRLGYHWAYRKIDQSTAPKP